MGWTAFSLARSRKMQKEDGTFEPLKEDMLKPWEEVIAGWEENSLDFLGKRKKTILVIDDMSEHLRTVKAILTNQYDVRLARSGELAQSILNTIFVDLILLDIEMPGESGFEYLKRLKTSPTTQHIPVIFLSSHAESEIVEYASQLDIKGYVKKPVDSLTLKQKVYEVLGKK
jgi:response regulator RpfG family c-di-GMP phosphodiesterase